jgi:hypothetical protein
MLPSQESTFTQGDSCHGDDEARPRRTRFGSYLEEISPEQENIINRDFHAKAPNEKWSTEKRG